MEAKASVTSPGSARIARCVPVWLSPSPPTTIAIRVPRAPDHGRAYCSTGRRPSGPTTGSLPKAVTSTRSSLGKAAERGSWPIRAASRISGAPPSRSAGVNLRTMLPSAVRVSSIFAPERPVSRRTPDCTGVSARPLAQQRPRSSDRWCRHRRLWSGLFGFLERSLRRQSGPERKPEDAALRPASRQCAPGSEQPRAARPVAAFRF